MQLSIKEIIYSSAKLLRVTIYMQRGTHIQTITLVKTGEGWAFGTSEATNTAAMLTLEMAANIKHFLENLDFSPLSKLDFEEHEYPEA